MALNTENLRNEIEALSSRQKFRFLWDPQLQAKKTLPGGVVQYMVSFSLVFARSLEADTGILDPAQRRRLIFKAVAKQVFEFFGDECDIMISTRPGKATERRLPVATPEQLAREIEDEGMLSIIERNHSVILWVTMPAKLSEAAEPGELIAADKAERFMNSLIATGANKQLMVFGMAEPDPIERGNPNHIMCMLRATHDNDDGIAPLKARLRSFANYVRAQLEEVSLEATIKLSIGAHLTPQPISPQQFADMIVGEYGGGSEEIFRIGFWLYYNEDR